MKPRSLLILVVVLVVFAGLAYWSRKPGGTAVVPVTLSGQKAFPDLKINDVAKLVFRGPETTITMAKVNGTWGCTERFNYPIRFAQLSDFLQQLANLKIGQCVAATESQLPRLQLVQPGQTNAEARAQTGTSITLLDSTGAEMASMLAGKLHHAEPSDDTGPTMPRDFGGMPDGRYILVKDRVFLVSDTLESIPAEPGAWFDTQLVNVQAGDVVDLAVEGPDRAPIHLSRPGGEGELKLEGLLPDQKPSQADIDALAGCLGYLRFQDIADPATDDATAGFDKAISVKVKAKNGAAYSLRIGKDVEPTKSKYVKVSVGFETPPAPPPNPAETNEAAIAAAATQLEQRNAAAAKEAEALNSRIAPWTYLVSDDVLKWCVLKPRETLIAKEEPKPAPPDNAPSAVPPVPAEPAVPPAPAEPAVPAPGPETPEAAVPPPPMPPADTNIQASAPAPVAEEQPVEKKKSRRGRRKPSKSADTNTPPSD